MIKKAGYMADIEKMKMLQSEVAGESSTASKMFLTDEGETRREGTEDCCENICEKDLSKGKNAFLSWISEHKRPLTVAGISIAALPVAFLLFKKFKCTKNIRDLLIFESENQETIANTDVEKFGIDLENLKESVETVGKMTRAPHDVSEHVRNLPLGRKASPEKIAIALEKGITLLDRQTLVKKYNTGGEVA